MKKRIAILLSVPVMFFGLSTYAQSTEGDFNSGIQNKSTYNTAIGLRAGTATSGLTFKQFIGSRTALEGILGVWHHGFSITGLYEKYTPAFNVRGLNWYYGGGAHVAFETGHDFYYRNERHSHYHDDYFGIGVDGLVGMEYKIPPIPVAVSFDLKPFVEIHSNGGGWFGLDPGLGIKFAF
jgi:hypothetical protein